MLSRRFEVTQVMSYGGYVLHIGSLESGSIKLNDHCTCAVDYDFRFLVAPNHTMTHLMNWAIRKVLKTEVDQKGSLVDDARLRFDFNSTKAVSPAQLAEIERLVNEKINAALTVYTEVVEISKAREICSLRAVFGEVGCVVWCALLTPWVALPQHGACGVDWRPRGGPSSGPEGACRHIRSPVEPQVV